MGSETLKNFNDIVASVKPTDQIMLLVFTAGIEKSDGTYGLLTSGMVSAARETARGVLQNAANNGDNIQAASAVINFPTIDLTEEENLRLEICAKLASNQD